MGISVSAPVLCPVLIGRGPELTSLYARLEQTISGIGQVVVLSGEAGIGKSRLVKEITPEATAEGFLVLKGSCFPTDQNCPYAPLLDLLRALLATEARGKLIVELGPLAAALFPLLPDLLPLPAELASLPALNPEQEKRRLFAALAQVFTSQAGTRAVLLVVEDLHWSDENSLEFLHYLARRTVAQRLFLLLTYRSDEVHTALQHLLAQLDRERLAHEYALGRLNRAEIEAMLAAIFANQQVVPGEFLELLSTLTDGNPFFVEEVLKSLLTSGAVTSTDGGWVRLLSAATADRQLTVPRSVQEAVQQRTTGLRPQARRLLTLAAVAGRRFDVVVLQRLLRCSPSQLVSLLKELVAAQLVVEDSTDQFSFRHALTRQAIYTGLLARERRVLHRRLARGIEERCAASAPATLNAYLADLAYHCFQGEEWEKAVEYGQRAGEKALILHAPRAALEHLTRAVRAAAQMSAPPPATLYRSRGQAYELLGEFELARSDYDEALHLAQAAQDITFEWQSLTDLGFLWASRDYNQAGHWFRRALELADLLGDPRLQASSLNRLGNWLTNTGKVEEGVQTHLQALRVFESQYDQQGMADTFDLLGTASFFAGDLITSASQYGQAIPLFRASGDLRRLGSSLAMRASCSSPTVAQTTYSPMRTRDACIQEAEEALRLARQADAPGDEAFAEFIMGSCAASFGEFGTGLAYAQMGLRAAIEVGHRQWIAGAATNLGGIYVLLLEPTAAREALEMALPLAHELGSAYWTTFATTYLARAHLLKHELQQAESALEAVLPREQRPRDWAERGMRLVWGELLLAQGHPDLALRLAEELLATVPGSAAVADLQPIPWLLRLEGETLLALGRVDEAIPVLEEAVRGASERHDRAHLWYTHGVLGRAYHLTRREESARREWIAARNAIASLAATIDEPALRQQFTHTALTTFWPEERFLPRRLLEADQYDGLTEREREVSAFIAQGKSNREIAELLVVHYRTVESHVSNVLSKLGFASRTQIAVWARDKGLGTHE